MRFVDGQSEHGRDDAGELLRIARLEGTRDGKAGKLRVGQPHLRPIVAVDGGHCIAKRRFFKRQHARYPSCVGYRQGARRGSLAQRGLLAANEPLRATLAIMNGAEKRDLSLDQGHQGLRTDDADVEERVSRDDLAAWNGNGEGPIVLRHRKTRPPLLKVEPPGSTAETNVYHGRRIEGEVRPVRETHASNFTDGCLVGRRLGRRDKTEGSCVPDNPDSA